MDKGTQTAREPPRAPVIHRGPELRVICAEADELIDMLNALAGEAVRVTGGQWKPARVDTKAVLLDVLHSCAVVVDVRIYKPGTNELPVLGILQREFERKYFGRVTISALFPEKSRACIIM